MKNTDFIDNNSETIMQKAPKLITKKEAFHESKRLLIKSCLLFSGMLIVIVVFFAFMPLLTSTLVEHFKNASHYITFINMLHDTIMTIAQFIFSFLLITALMMLGIYYLNFRSAKKDMEQP